MNHQKILLAISFNHKDIEQTLRLLKWIGFLSYKDGGSMKKESILLVPSVHASRRALMRPILHVATKVFGEARCHIPDGEDERGWPESCNFMFRETLRHCAATPELSDRDIFWLEPDAIPLTPEWFKVIREEWFHAKEQGKSFMGALVTYGLEHMTGVAMYGRDWRSLAPKLETAVVYPWDLDAANQVLPRAHLVRFIQHVWMQPHITLEAVNPDAVIFHQDKRGRLIEMIDQSRFDGEADRIKLFHYSTIKEPVMPRKYYHADNSNRAIRSQGHVFIFEPYDQFGGAWRGTYTTDNDAEIVALAALCQDPRHAVTEISQAEYEEKAKKKAPLSPTLEPSNQTFPQVQLKPSPAVLVENPDTSELPTQEKAPTVNSIEDVLEVGAVTVSPTADHPAKRKRPGSKNG